MVITEGIPRHDGDPGCSQQIVGHFCCGGQGLPLRTPSKQSSDVGKDENLERIDMRGIEQAIVHLESALEVATGGADEAALLDEVHEAVLFERLASLEMILSLGAPLHLETKDRLNSLLPRRFYELYGLTEGFLTVLDRDDE